ncbi:MAG: nucleotidyltransferase [Ruminococcaceae bacterium]|nr:nucleotidyltransferase [Oscillospiraceae bacterium]
MTNIKLPDELREELKNAHKELRDNLKTDDITSTILVDSFLQGSYARATCIKPQKGDKVDVDVIAVTNINHNLVSAEDAFQKILPFVEKYYEDFRPQKRSVGISLDNVDVDLVITAAPSEEVMREITSARLNEGFTIDNILEVGSINYRNDSLSCFFNSDESEKMWRKEPLLIPDSEENNWFRTHPLEQIRWTKEKNRLCNDNYVNVVKALKWWKTKAMPDAKHPKSYPLEHFIGDCCPNGIESVAEGIVKTLEKMLCYPSKPILNDRGVPEHDVFESLSTEDYNKFYNTIKKYAVIARRAYDCEESNIEECVCLWREFFGNCPEFPPFRGPSGGFTPRTQKTETLPSGRFG